MKLSGQTELEGTPEEIFKSLLDPLILRRSIPGCESLEETAPSTYEITVKAGIGSVRGTFKGEVQLTDVVAPESYSMSVKGKSSVGHAEGGASVKLEAQGEGDQTLTLIHYEGQAKVSGMIAAVGGRLVQVAAKKIAQQFFDKIGEELRAGS